MWKVIRQRQGEPYSAEAAEISAADRSMAFRRNVHTLQHHERKPYAPPKNVFIFTRPYAGFEFTKVKKHMRYEVPTTLRVQALEFLIQALRERRGNVVRGVNEGILDALVHVGLRDPSSRVRCLAGEAIAVVVKEVEGQVALLANGSNENLSVILETAAGEPWDASSAATHASDDENEEAGGSAAALVAELGALAACHAAFNQYEATSQLVNSLNCISTYVSLVGASIASMKANGAKSTNVRVCGAACAALVPVFAVKESFIPFLDCGGMSAVVEVLHVVHNLSVQSEASEDAEAPSAEDVAHVFKCAAEIIFYAAHYPAACEAAMRNHVLPALVAALHHPSFIVRREVAAALAQLSIAEQCKMEVAGSPELLEAFVVRIREEDERDVLSFCLATVLNVAEHPAARDVWSAELKSYVDGIIVTAKSENDTKLADTATKVSVMLSRRCFRQAKH